MPAVFTFVREEHYRTDPGDPSRHQCKHCFAWFTRNGRYHLASCPGVPRTVTTLMDHQARLDAEAGVGYYADHGELYAHFRVVGYLKQVCKRCGTWLHGRPSSLKRHLRTVGCTPGPMKTRADPATHFTHTSGGGCVCRFCKERPRLPTPYYKSLHLATCPKLPSDVRDEMDYKARIKAQRRVDPYHDALFDHFEVLGHFAAMCRTCGVLVFGANARLSRHRNQKRCQQAQAALRDGRPVRAKQYSNAGANRTGSRSVDSGGNTRDRAESSQTGTPSSSEDETAGDWPPVRFDHHFYRCRTPHEFEGDARHEPPSTVAKGRKVSAAR